MDGSVCRLYWGIIADDRRVVVLLRWQRQDKMSTTLLETCMPPTKKWALYTIEANSFATNSMINKAISAPCQENTRWIGTSRVREPKCKKNKTEPRRDKPNLTQPQNNNENNNNNKKRDNYTTTMCIAFIVYIKKYISLISFLFSF